jgi:hypothetical protein
MKNIFKLLGIAFFLTLLTSCDPSQDIRFVNKTDSNVMVKIILEPNAKDFRLKEVATKDSIVFNLRKDSIAEVDCGMGTWSEDEVIRFTNSVKSIEFDTKDIKTIYKSKRSMKAILEENEKGIFFRNLIEIEIQ